MGEYTPRNVCCRMQTSDHTICWVESLAQQELLIHAGDKVSLDVVATKNEVLLLETSSFLRDLYYQFHALIRVFNGRVGSSPLLELKLSRSESVDQFQISRNGMRLVFSRPLPGVIQASCERLASQDFSRTHKASVMFTGMVEGKFGNFHEVEWFFLGARIAAEQVARHYLTEFLQVSRVG